MWLAQAGHSLQGLLVVGRWGVLGQWTTVGGGGEGGRERGREGEREGEGEGERE